MTEVINDVRIPTYEECCEATCDEGFEIYSHPNFPGGNIIIQLYKERVTEWYENSGCCHSEEKGYKGWEDDWKRYHYVFAIRHFRERCGEKLPPMKDPYSLASWVKESYTDGELLESSNE